MEDFIHIRREYCEEYVRLERKRDEAGNEYRHYKKEYCSGRMTRELKSTLEELRQDQFKAISAVMDHPDNCPYCQALRNAPPDN